MVDGTVNVSLNLFGTERLWVPPDESPAVSEIAEYKPTHLLGLGPILDAQSHARLITMAALDHLGAVGTLLSSSGRSIFGGPAMTRVTIEAAAVAWWALEPGIGASERVVRGFAIRIEGLRHTIKVATGITGEGSPETARQERRLAEILEEARAAGVKVHKEDGTVVGLHHAVPSERELVRLLFKEMSVDEGAGIYSHLSGIVHSSPTSLLQFTEIVDSPDDDGLMTLQPRITLAQAEQVVMIAMMGYLGMFDRVVSYYGLDARQWASWRRHASGVLLARK